MIAALYVSETGPYVGRPDVDAWPESRDARNYAGPHPVVAHPPCERWGRYWGGGPSAKVKRTLGDDGGCFAAALAAVRAYGGVLEHPEASHAFAAHGLLRPVKRLGPGWHESAGGIGKPFKNGKPSRTWVCCVEQGHYGHPARKATWLCAVLPYWDTPPDLVWGPSQGQRLDEGFHSREERQAARAAGVKPRPRLSKAQNLHTPAAFAEVLIQLTESCNA